MVDFELARRETPGCKNVLHFNNAGAALMPQVVLDATKSHLQLEAEIGGYEAAEKEIDKLNKTYDSAAALFGCQRHEIAFIENATRAWDMAFYSFNFKPGDRILTAVAEYASNYIAYLQIAKKTGAKIDVIPNDENGQISLDALRNMIDEKVKLISITHVPTSGGLVNPAYEIGQIAKTTGIPYLLDACQSVGQIPIDVKAIGCSFLSGTGRKYLRGPRGTGFLYVSEEFIDKTEPPFLDLHSANWTEKDNYTVRNDARKFENWETNFAGKIGLGSAIDYAMDWGIENINERVVFLAEKLRSELNTIPKIVTRDLGAVKCGIVTFTVDEVDTAALKKTLRQRKINVTVSVPEYTRLDFEARNIESMVRSSVHYYNTEDEIETFCQTLKEIVV